MISTITKFLQWYLVVLASNGIALVENWKFRGSYHGFVSVARILTNRKAVVLPLASYLSFPAGNVMLPSVLSIRLCLYSSSLPILFAFMCFIKVYTVTVALTVN